MITDTVSMVQKILKYIEENLCEELTPGIIAKEFYTSISAVSQAFKIVCGISIMEYVRNRRLTLAGEELVRSDIPIIELAYKYGYETPEAFTKAFSRFHGFPPGFVRRTFPERKVFHPLQIEIVVSGGWDREKTTNVKSGEQDTLKKVRYDDFTNHKGGSHMKNKEIRCKINTCDMYYRKEWDILLKVSQKLLKKGIPFKVDGKTMIFAHGLEFCLERICLTFKWNDEQKVKAFFMCHEQTILPQKGFKYFDTFFEGMKIRCMFYGGTYESETDEFLFRNAEPVLIDDTVIPVQSLEFYVENAEKDTEYYRMVKSWLELQKNG